MKTDINDITFQIPIRIDSIVRLENLIMSVQSLLRSFDTHITILEASNYPNGILQKMFGNKVEYLFLEDKDPVFYRTKYLNIMTRRSQTPYIGIWDADVIIPKKQILDSIEKLRQGIEIAYPYDGHFYDTSNVIRELYFQNNPLFSINLIEGLFSPPITSLICENLRFLRHSRPFFTSLQTEYPAPAIISSNTKNELKAET